MCYLGRPEHKNIIERARNKAFIALRKAGGEHKEEPASRPAPSSARAASHQDYYEQDLDLIVKHLKSEWPESMSDEQIFAQLAREVSLASRGSAHRSH